MNPTKGDGLTVCTSQPAKTHTNNAADFIVACTRVASVRAAFHAKPCAGITKRRKSIWEALHLMPKMSPAFATVFGQGLADAAVLCDENETLIEGGIQVGQVVPPDIGYKKPPPQALSFAAETAAITGESKRDVNRHIARAEALGDDIDRLAGTSPALMFLSQDYSKSQVSGVSGVQAPIHAGFSRYLTFFHEVSGVSARGIRRRKWRTTKAQFADNGAALNPSRRCRAVERALRVCHLKRPVRVAGAFQAGRCKNIWRTGTCVLGRCDKVPATPEMGPVHKNIVIDNGAQTHALSWVFSRLEFSKAEISALHGFGRDGRCGNARRMALSMFLTSRPPDARKNADGGLQSHNGAESMTTTTPQKGTLTLGTTPATSPATLVRRLAIETALSAALHLVRTSDTPHSIQLATGRAIRAASMLKQACAEATTTTAGRV